MSDNDSSDRRFAPKDGGDDNDDGPVLKSPKKQTTKRPTIWDDDDSDSDNEPPPSKKNLKMNPPSPNNVDKNDTRNKDGGFLLVDSDDDNDHGPVLKSPTTNNNSNGGWSNNNKPEFMETLPIDLVENQIWSYLTTDDFYCFGYSSQAMKEYVLKYAHRQGKWRCKTCNCHLFSVLRRVLRFQATPLKILAPHSCNCECGGDDNNDPNCRWLCNDCSFELVCKRHGCEEKIVDYCFQCWSKMQCETCESYFCPKCHRMELGVFVCPYPCGRRVCRMSCPECTCYFY